MGHARVDNISRCFNRMVKREGGATIREVVDELERTKQALHAGEGDLDDRCMLSLGVEVIVEQLLNSTSIEPVDLTRRQKSLLKQWRMHDSDEWDCGDDGESGEYGILDSIRWRALKKRLPVIEYHEN
jgi:hypothetical protein